MSVSLFETQPESLAILRPQRSAGWEEFRRRGQVRIFRAGDALIRAHGQSSSVLLIRSGIVKVSRMAAGGVEVVLAFRGPGELIGELAATDEMLCSASVIALERVDAYVLPTSEFRSLLRTQPDGQLLIMGELARRLRESDEQRVGQVGCSLPRVACRLLDLGARFGAPSDEGLRIALPVTQSDLASWCGCSLESLGRALRSLRELHAIETGRMRIVILDEVKLRELATI